MNIESLKSCIDKLPPGKQSFAASLIAQSTLKRGLSDAQRLWVGKLVEMANNPPPPRPTVEVGDMTGIITLFETAAKKLKAPFVVLQLIVDVPAQSYHGDCDHGHPAHREAILIRLSRAGTRAKVPDSINVMSDGRYGERDWFGRIRQDGTFEPSFKVKQPAGLVELLRTFAAKPAETAAEHGKLLGHCCFCIRNLSDERSLAVGYGGTCAKNWNLPWGTFVRKPDGERAPGYLGIKQRVSADVLRAAS